MVCKSHNTTHILKYINFFLGVCLLFFGDAVHLDIIAELSKVNFLIQHHLFLH